LDIINKMEYIEYREITPEEKEHKQKQIRGLYLTWLLGALWGALIMSILYTAFLSSNYILLFLMFVLLIIFLPNHTNKLK